MKSQSVAPARGGALPSWGPTFLRRAAAWVVVLSVVLGAFGITEASLLLRDGFSLRMALTCGAVTVAFGHLLALAAAPFFAAGSLLVRILRRLWLAPIALGTGALSWRIPAVSLAAHPPLRLVVAVGCAAVITLFAWLSRTPRDRLALLGVAVTFTLGFLLDLLTPGEFYPELHDLLALLAVGSALVALRPLHEWLRKVSPVRMAPGLAVGALVATLWTVWLAERIVPGWRATAWTHGRYTWRMANFARGLVDFDGDDFSPIAWGGIAMISIDYAIP